MSAGSHAESASTVRPDGSITVPVASCLVSCGAEVWPAEEYVTFKTICTVTTACWLLLKMARPLSASSLARELAASKPSRQMEAIKNDLRLQRIIPFNEFFSSVRFQIGRASCRERV